MKKVISGRCMVIIITITAVFAAFALQAVVYSAENEEGVYYTCPMPSHADVARSEPGKCPKCGMDLVKKEIGDTKFVCPMKGDEDVISDKPGKCPKCGMWLVPKKADDSSQGSHGND